MPGVEIGLRKGLSKMGVWLSHLDDRDGLVARFESDNDGSGQMTVTARLGDFSGASVAWFDPARIIEWARTLRTYPIPGGQVLTLASGFGRAPENLDQEHVRIDVRAVGHRGQLGVNVHLATPVWPHDPPHSVSEVRLEIPTSYESLRRFAGELETVVQAGDGEARLESERLI